MEPLQRQGKVHANIFFSESVRLNVQPLTRKTQRNTPQLEILENQDALLNPEFSK